MSDGTTPSPPVAPPDPQPRPAPPAPPPAPTPPPPTPPPQRRSPSAKELMVTPPNPSKPRPSPVPPPPPTPPPRPPTPPPQRKSAPDPLPQPIPRPAPPAPPPRAPTPPEPPAGRLTPPNPQPRPPPPAPQPVPAPPPRPPAPDAPIAHGFRINSLMFKGLLGQVCHQHICATVPDDDVYRISVPRDLFAKDIVNIDFEYTANIKLEKLSNKYTYGETGIIHDQWAKTMRPLKRPGASYIWPLVMYLTEHASMRDPAVPSHEIEILLDFFNDKVLLARVLLTMRERTTSDFPAPGQFVILEGSTNHHFEVDLTIADPKENHGGHPPLNMNDNLSPEEVQINDKAHAPEEPLDYCGANGSGENPPESSNNLNEAEGHPPPPDNTSNGAEGDLPDFNCAGANPPGPIKDLRGIGENDADPNGDAEDPAEPNANLNGAGENLPEPNGNLNGDQNLPEPNGNLNGAAANPADPNANLNGGGNPADRNDNRNNPDVN